jgi:tRNA(Ile)-lysidine synthase
VSIGECTLRRYRGVLHLVPGAAALLPGVKAPRSWRGETRLELPEWHGVLHMRRRRGAGIDLEKLLARPVTVRARSGGEKLQPESARPRRALKDLFQMLAVPPWRRDQLPLLWSGERLVWAAGVGIDCAFRAQAGAPGVTPRWVARAAIPVTR